MLSAPSSEDLPNNNQVYSLYLSCQKYVLLKQEYQKILELNYSKLQQAQNYLLKLSWYVYIGFMREYCGVADNRNTESNAFPVAANGSQQHQFKENKILNGILKRISLAHLNGNDDSATHSLFDDIWNIRPLKWENSHSPTIPVKFYNLFDKFGNRMKYFENFVKFLLEYPQVTAAVLCSQTLEKGQINSDCGHRSQSNENVQQLIHSQLSSLSLKSGNSEEIVSAPIFDHFTSSFPNSPLFEEFEEFLEDCIYGLYGNLNNSNHLILVVEKVLEIESSTVYDLGLWLAGPSLFSKILLNLVRHECFGMKVYLKKVIEPVILKFLQNEFKKEYLSSDLQEITEIDYEIGLLESILGAMSLIPIHFRYIFNKLANLVKIKNNCTGKISDYFIKKILLPFFINPDSEFILDKDIYIINSTRKKLISIAKNIHKNRNCTVLLSKIDLQLVKPVILSNPITAELPKNLSSHVLISSKFLLKCHHLIKKLIGSKNNEVIIGNVSPCKISQEFKECIDKLSSFHICPEIYHDKGIIHIMIGQFQNSIDNLPISKNNNNLIYTDKQFIPGLVEMIGCMTDIPAEFKTVKEMCEFGIERFAQFGDIPKSIHLKHLIQKLFSYQLPSTAKSEQSIQLSIRNFLSDNACNSQTFENEISQIKSHLTLISSQIKSLQTLYFLNINWLKTMIGQELLFSKDSVLHDIHVFSFATCQDKNLQIQRYVEDLLKSVIISSSGTANNDNKKFLKDLFISRIYDQFLLSMDQSAQRENIYFYKRMTAASKKYQNCSDPIFGINPLYHSMNWNVFSHQLSKINILRSPSAKLACISQTFQQISSYLGLINPVASGADDIFPILVYVILKADIVFLHTTIELISSFCLDSSDVSGHGNRDWAEGNDSTSRGEDVYWYNQFLAAIQILRKTII